MQADHDKTIKRLELEYTWGWGIYIPLFAFFFFGASRVVFNVPSGGGMSALGFESRFRLRDDFLVIVFTTSCGCASVLEFARDVSELPDEWGES